MKDKTKSKEFDSINPSLRFSKSSFNNSTQNQELDYNIYCYSQGYKNKEKGYWRGVLRGKNADNDLRNNKEWNRPIDFEDDEIEKTHYSTIKSDLLFSINGKYPKEYLNLINNSESAWDSEKFKNFQKYQKQKGITKENDKEWILSNGIKRNKLIGDNKTQNYNQFSDKSKTNIEINQYEKEERTSKYNHEYGYNIEKRKKNEDKEKNTGLGIYKTQQISVSIKNDDDNSKKSNAQIDKSAKITITQSNDWNKKKAPIGLKKTNGFIGIRSYGIDNKLQEKKEFKFGQFIDQTNNLNKKKVTQQAKNASKFDLSINNNETKVNRNEKYDRKVKPISNNIDRINISKENKNSEIIYKYDKSSNIGKFDSSIDKQKRNPSNNSQNEINKRSGYEVNKLKDQKMEPGRNISPKTGKYNNEKIYQPKIPSSQYDNKNIQKYEKTSYDKKYEPSNYRTPYSSGKEPQQQKYTNKITYNNTLFNKPKSQNEVITKKFIYEKSSYKPLKTQPTSNKSSYDKSKIGTQTSQKPKYDKYNTRTLDKTNSEQNLQKNIYDRNKANQQAKIQIQSYKTQSKIMKTTYDINNNKQNYAQYKPQIQNDIKKYSSYTDKKPLTNTKNMMDKETQNQKQNYVKKFDLNDYINHRAHDKKKSSSLTKGELHISEKRLERPENLVRLEVSVERINTDRELSERKPELRKHERIYSSKKKKRQNYDSEGKPLTNIMRLDDSVERKNKKNNEPRLPNFSRYEDYNIKREKDNEEIRRPIVPRLNEILTSGKKKRKEFFVNEVKAIDNVGRINVNKEKNKANAEKPNYVQNKDNKQYITIQKAKNDQNELKTKYNSGKYLPKESNPNKRQKYDSESSLKNKISSDINNKRTAYVNPSTNIETAKQITLSRAQTTKTLFISQNNQINRGYHQQSKTNITDYPKPQNYENRKNQNYQQYSIESKTQKQKDYIKRPGTGNTYSLNSSNLKTTFTNKNTINGKNIKGIDGPRIEDKLIIDKKYIKNVNRNPDTQSQSSLKNPQNQIKPFAISSNLLEKENRSTNLIKNIKPVKENKNNYYPPATKSLSVPKKSTSGEKHPPKNTSQTQNIEDNKKSTQITNSKLGQQGYQGYFISQNNIHRKQNDQYIKNQPSINESDIKIKTIYKKGEIGFRKKVEKTSDIQINKNYQNQFPSKIPKQEQDKTKIINAKNSESDKDKNNQIENKTNYQYRRPTSSSLFIKKNAEDQRHLIQSTQDYKYPNNGINYVNGAYNSNTYKNATDKYKQQGDYGKYSKYNINSSHKVETSFSSNTFDKNKIIVSRSQFNQKDKNTSFVDNSKFKKSTTEKYKFNTVSEAQKKDINQTNKNNQNNKYTSYDSSGYTRGNSMAYFKCKFLTTKEICEMFWKSIDKGELPISMFDVNKNSDSNSKFYTPKKVFNDGRYSKLNSSNGETDYSMRPSEKKNYNRDNNMNYSKSVRNINQETRFTYKS